MTGLSFRKAAISDVDLLYQWVNDPLVRENSFQQSQVNFEDHVKWFEKKLKSKDCYIYIFINDNGIPVGQVRIDKDDNETIIGLSIDQQFRGLSLGATLLTMACDAYLKENSDEIIVAYIKENNIPSYKIFAKAGFGNASKVLHSNNISLRLTKTYEHL